MPSTTAALHQRAEAVVDLDAVQANVAALVEHVRPAAVMAVVKADAYGHGAVPCARAALAGGATSLGVAFVEEAVALREAGITEPILSLVEPAPATVATALAHDVELGVGTEHAIEVAAEAGRALGRPAHLHLKVDTGLSRGGATADAWPGLLAAAAAAQASGAVKVVGVWSHLACADEPADLTTADQVQRFRAAVALAERAGIRPGIRHLANSAGALAFPDTAFDVVRVGIAMYGLPPVPTALELRPAMTLRTRVALTKQVDAGAGVSYGHRYRTTQPTTLALLPLGYADGVPRAAGNTAEIWVAGSRRRISGTVCMDQFVVDVDDGTVAAGDEALLFGPGDRGEPTAEDWARWLGTISYEIVTRIGQRVPRTFAGGAQQ